MRTWWYSELIEGDNVDRLHVVLKFFNLLLHDVSGHFIIFDCRTNYDLENTVGDGLLLPFSLPVKTVHLDAENPICEGLKIGVLTPWLDLPDDEGLGDGGRLLALLGCSSLLLNSLSSGCISLTILREWIEIVLFSSCCGLCCLFLRRSACFATLLATFLTSSCGGSRCRASGPGSSDTLLEAADKGVPSEGVWVGIHIGHVATHCNELLVVLLAWLLATEPLVIP